MQDNLDILIGKLIIAELTILTNNTDAAKKKHVDRMETSIA